MRHIPNVVFPPFLLLSIDSFASSFAPSGTTVNHVFTGRPFVSRSKTSLFDASNPLAEEGDWAAYLDEDSTGLIYYFNARTGEAVWSPPTDTFPSVELSRQTRRSMRKKRREYEKSISASDAEQPSKGGLLEAVFGGKTEEAVVDNVAEKVDVAGTEEATERRRGFFETVFGGSEPATGETGFVTEENTLGGGGFFDNVFGGSEPATSEAAVVADDTVDQVNGDAKKKSSSSSTPPSTPVKKTGIKEDFVEESVTSADAAPIEKPVKVQTPTFALPDLTDLLPKPKEEELIIPADNPIDIAVSAFVKPHPAKISWGGEDAVFTSGRTFGVFDGVSGADKLDGVELYSCSLSRQMKNLVGREGLTIEEMTGLLTAAAEIADIEATGASTAVVASIGEDGYLRALNLGDSVLLVIRDNAVVARTKDIVHYFECPYQLGQESPDRPKDGTKLKTQVFPGDIIVAGSDGVFDNLSDEVLCETVASTPLRPSLIAKQVVEKSRKISLDTEAETPYAKIAKRYRVEEYENGLGGKVDDVSCVVVQCT